VKRLVLVALTGALVLAGCGGGGSETTSTETTTTVRAQTVSGRVYFLHGGKVWPVARELEPPDVAVSALAALYAGPTADERQDLQLATAVPDVNPGIDRLEIDKAREIARYGPPADLSRKALAQVVYTLTQFPSVKAVEIGGKRYTRADFEDETPAILVESPLAWQKVGSPLRVTGTANTFEATFEYELTDTDGKIVDSHFVTATSGSGTRGTFDFTTKPYAVPFSGVGALIVSERSAKDGSRIHLVEIPLRMGK